MIAEQEIDKGMVTLRIIWIAMLVFLALYLIVGLMVAPSMPASIGGEAFAMLRTALYALAFITLIAAGFIRRLILGEKSRSESVPQVPRTGEIQKYSSAVIASLAMSESIGIYGLVLFILGKSTSDLYLLLGISAAAMIYYRPRKDDVIDLSRRMPQGPQTGPGTDR